MKNIITIILSIFFTLNTIAQANEIQVIAKGNSNKIADNIFTVDIFVKALNTNETVTINSQNYRFDYNIKAIRNPSIVSTTGGLGYSNPVFSDNGNISFFEMPTLTGSISNLISFNIEMSGGAGLLLTNEEEIYIGSIAFEVINSNLPYNFDWHHFTSGGENWPPTYIGIQNSTERATGIFTNNINDVNISIADFTRTATHVCTTNNGALSIAYPDRPAHENLFISIDGGLTYTSVGTNNPFVVEDLPAGNYDIKVKQGETGLPLTLDDINIIDLSHQVKHKWTHPTCGNNDGWIELTWVKKALPKIDISIDGGQTYVSVQAANKVYRIENLAEGDYDIRVKWSYAPFACPTILGDVNLRFSNQCKLGKNDLNQIQVYPNPANQQVRINLESATFRTGTIAIYNLAGKLIQANILAENQSATLLQVGTLSNGIYLIKTTTDGKQIGTQKLTIAH